MLTNLALACAALLLVACTAPSTPDPAATLAQPTVTPLGADATAVAPGQTVEAPVAGATPQPGVTPPPPPPPGSEPAPTPSPDRPSATAAPRVDLLACVVDAMRGLHDIYQMPPPEDTTGLTEPTPVDFLQGCALDDPAGQPIPRVVTAHYLMLDHVARLSKFRSSAGHDFSDDFESCSSMKHYYRFVETLDWAAEPVFAPLDGAVVATIPEAPLNGQDSGLQVWIASAVDPRVQVRIFHMALDPAIARGSAVAAGQRIGQHIGRVSWSDIAVQQVGPSSRRYLSHFDVMTDALFADYRALGVRDRATPQLSLAERQASPLTCDGQRFANTQGDVPSEWIDLR